MAASGFDLQIGLASKYFLRLTKLVIALVGMHLNTSSKMRVFRFDVRNQTPFQNESIVGSIILIGMRSGSGSMRPANIYNFK